MLHKSENRKGGVGMRSWPAEAWRCSVSAKAQLQPLSMSPSTLPTPRGKVCLHWSLPRLRQVSHCSEDRPGLSRAGVKGERLTAQSDSRVSLRPLHTKNPHSRVPLQSSCCVRVRQGGPRRRRAYSAKRGNLRFSFPGLNKTF